MYYKRMSSQVEGCIRRADRHMCGHRVDDTTRQQQRMVLSRSTCCRRHQGTQGKAGWTRSSRCRACRKGSRPMPRPAASPAAARASRSLCMSSAAATAADQASLRFKSRSLVADVVVGVHKCKDYTSAQPAPTIVLAARSWTEVWWPAGLRLGANAGSGGQEVMELPQRVMWRALCRDFYYCDVSKSEVDSSSGRYQP
jgi:hypothetical protein